MKTIFKQLAASSYDKDHEKLIKQLLKEQCDSIVSSVDDLIGKLKHFNKALSPDQRDGFEKVISQSLADASKIKDKFRAAKKML